MAMSRLDRNHKPPVLEVFTQDRTTGSWTSTTTDLASFTTTHNANRTSPPKIQIAFLTVPTPGPSPASVLTPQDQTHLQSVIGFKSSYWSPAQQQAAGYFSLHCPRVPSPGTLVAVTITKFLIKKAHASDPSRPSRLAIAHDWIGIDVLCRWTRDGSGASARTGVLALIPCSPPCVRDGIASLLHGQFSAAPLSTADPFGVLDPVLEYAGGLFEEAIWSWRDHVRWFEVRREEGMEEERRKYEAMHEVARHAIHCKETVGTAIGVVEGMLEEWRVWDERPGEEGRETARGLRGHASLLRCLEGRAEALCERLRNEISLAFTAVGQQHSRTSVRIAEGIQSDSASTKTISVLGVIFLPAAVVSSIFSTAFFDVDTVPSTVPGGKARTEWRVADQFWIYWACAIPLTIVTMVVWTVWYYYFLKKKQAGETRSLAQAEVQDSRSLESVEAGWWSKIRSSSPPRSKTI